MLLAIDCGNTNTVFSIWNGTGFVATIAWRQGTRELRLIAISLALSLALGVHDVILLAGWAWPEHIYLMPFATLVIVGSFLYAVQRRFLGALRQVEQANDQLGQRLSEQGAELQAQHESLGHLWQALRPWLSATAEGQACPPPAEVDEFALVYPAHAAREEAEIYPAAAQLSAAQLRQISDAMVRRRTPD